MRKILMPVLLVLLLLALPAAAGALTVSGSLQQLNRSGGVPLADIAVHLEREDGFTLSARTGANGEYRFSNVEAGTYRVKVRLPQDHVAAAMGDNSALLPSNSEEAATPWMKITEDTRIPLGSSRTTAGISVSAFVDSNENGGHMSTEPALAGVTVEVYADGYLDLPPVASAVSNKKGELSLPGMSPGTYRLKAILPSGYMIGPVGSKVNIYYNCFRLNDAGEAWTDPITLEKGTQGMGVGAVAAGSAKGLIYLDQNQNGRMDAGETGFQEAAVSVYSESQGFEMKAQVQQDGTFVFDPLQPGAYSFRVTLPEGFMFAAPGSGSLLTNGYGSSDAAPITVAREKITEIGSVGVIPASGVSVRFYLDENANGRMDQGEKPFAGHLSIRAGGQEVLAVSADENGLARAPVVREGALTLTASVEKTGGGGLPLAADGIVFSIPGSQNDFSAGTAVTSVALDIELAGGEQKTLYAGVTQSSSVSGQVYMDANGSGVWDPLEGTLPDFTVQMVDAEGSVTAQTVTDRSGTFLFPALQPGEQTVRILLKDPYIASVPDGKADTCIVSQTTDYGETAPFRLKPGQKVDGLQMALFMASTIQGHVLVHEADGRVTGLKDVQAVLIRQDGTRYSDFASDRTNEEGFFFLKGILPGTYTVLYTLPDHALFENTDSLSVYSPAVECGNGTEAAVPDVFAVRTAQVAGTVTMDGLPVGNAKVTAVHQESGRTATVETDQETGAFDLKLLRPGTYQITAVLPETLVFGAETMLVPACADNVSNVTLPLAMGQHLTDQSVTATYPAVVNGTVYYDADHSDRMEAGEEKLPGFELALCGAGGEVIHSLTADENGAFTTPLLVPDSYRLRAVLEEDCILVGGYQISQTEWVLDVRPGSGETLEQDVGILRFASLSGHLWSLDGSKRHVGGLRVSLLNGEDDDLPLAETVTDEDGYYEFVRLYPGQYRLKVQLPEGFGFARNADMDGVRSSVILSNDRDGISAPFTLVMGEKQKNADIGFGAKGSTGDFAWLDENGNGMQDIGEKGIPGIRLELYQGDELVAQTETDIYGHFMFRDIYPGKYTLRVTMHPELRTTVHQTEFPLINSIMPEADGLTVEADIMIPSGTTTLSNDLGFVLRREGVYPAVMDTIPTMDWSYGGRKNNGR